MFFTRFLVCALILSSCGAKKDQINKQAPETTVKKIDNQLYFRAAPLFDCKALEEFDAQYDSSVKKRLKNLISKNTVYFNGFYDQKNLCFLLDTETEDINASAASEDGSILISRKLNELRDELFIAVMAHELSHILGRHEAAGIDFPHPWLLNDDDYKQKSTRFTELSGKALQIRVENFPKIELDAYPKNSQKLIQNEIIRIKNLSFEKMVYSGIKSNSFQGTEGISVDFDTSIFDFLTEKDKESLSAFDQSPEWVDELQSLSDEMIDYPIQALGEDKAYTWKEIDADNFGLQLMINAGYEKKHFIEMLELLLGRDLKKCHDLLETGKEPRVRSAFSSSHPTTCWRIFNLK